MEIGQDDRAERDIIKGAMECGEHFKCERSDSADSPKVEHFWKLLVCSEPNVEKCRFALFSGEGYFCLCPLNNYVHSRVMDKMRQIPSQI